MSQHENVRCLRWGIFDKVKLPDDIAVFIRQGFKIRVATFIYFTKNSLVGSKIHPCVKPLVLGMRSKEDDSIET